MKDNVTVGDESDEAAHHPRELSSYKEDKEDEKITFSVGSKVILLLTALMWLHSTERSFIYVLAIGNGMMLIYKVQLEGVVIHVDYLITVFT